MLNKRNRTPSSNISRALYLYFLGLSTRGVAKAMFFLHKVKRSHVAIWNWIQKYKPQKISIKRKSISEFIVDETLIKVGPKYIWLWVTIEPENRQILALFLLKISKERNMFVAERFLSGLVEIHGKHPVSTDGGTWYPQACRFLKIRHHLNSSYEKSIIERTIQYIKDRTESFDDYFPCRKVNSKLNHIINWLNLFVDYHNNELKVLK
ncbi:DDE-type integrase/transposase/recombinase [Candidatus Nitrosocosmicus agrestis]|jgi:putative transposase|uniref:DDE-type integrase/transposase/recombinase n=1 Tax=Candidatus Nitrosocosmicus agrestis TaxID=2563600 RepID=UPI00122E829A|nr:DDE-type integrase/transposase/recombinase [Candidatus Nitrosocosmicus sp. SS]KAA2279838.1 IS6 family transposase [Candidatus Nitrosocosmicus sp. SS]KAF0870366.1 IS6 family transposase [Candidatus Nitrosocosmicus sp. SS]